MCMREQNCMHGAACAPQTPVAAGARSGTGTFSRRADAPRSSCSTRFTRSTSSATSFSSPNVVLSW